MINLEIEKPNFSLEEELQHKLDNKAKPVGSLGFLEEMALRIGMIQGTDKPVLTNPTMLTIAADHGITEEGVSPCPIEITWQQVLNFLNGGGGIGLFCKVYGLDLKVVDAGVKYNFEDHPNLIKAKIAEGTKNFHKEPAMSKEQCLKALNNGSKITKDLRAQGSNIVGFGEMGIGNTSPASVLMSIICNIPIEVCVGPGAGLNKEGISNKTRVLSEALKKHGVSKDPLINLATYGGFEIATIAGAMLEAARNKMIIIVDGFITTSAALAAYSINPNVADYFFFSHQSNEGGHKLMLEFFNARPILSLDLRLGEGTGAAIAYSVIKGAVAVITDMTSFDEGKVFNTSHIRI